MTNPQTVEAALESLLDRLLAAADTLAAEAKSLRRAGSENGLQSDLERLAFREQAAAGARRYVEILRSHLAAGGVSYSDLKRAQLVVRTAELSGWISTAVAHNDNDRAAVHDLCVLGVLQSYPEVPGRWVACYRLVAGQ